MWRSPRAVLVGLERVKSSMRRFAGSKMRLDGRSQLKLEHPESGLVDFICNICGCQNLAVARELVQNREAQSCVHCRSSLRMRAVVHALSNELYGESLLLPEFPPDKTVVGLGMSDWVGYASWLEKKFSYTNTYYHTEPRLDIVSPHERWLGKNRFVISSDVFEHIPIRGLRSSFRNCHRLLSGEGVLIFTAPFTKDGRNQEHFPSLNEFHITETDGRRILHNRTIDGTEESFENLIFHGGDGATLEMRIFSEPDLRQSFEEAGFSTMKIYSDIVPELGILWPMDWAVPIAVRR